MAASVPTSDGIWPGIAWGLPVGMIRTAERRRGPGGRSVVRLIAATCLLCSSCGSGPGGGGAGFHDLFTEVARVRLQESPDDPIVDIDCIGQRPGGGYLIADRHAGRVRLFNATGKQVGLVGRPGNGPGELQEPSAAVELPDGRIIVLQRATPRLTIFRPDSAPVVARVPGYYGFWATRVGEGLVAGVATRDLRFARFDGAGRVLVRFGARGPAIEATPFWIYFAADHAAVLGRVIAVNTSLFPTIRLFDLQGDSVGTFDVAPPDWAPVTAPPVADLSAPGNRAKIEAWARTFTVVRQLVPVDDSLLVVEYGRHDPQPADPYFVAPTTAAVYTARGTRLGAGLTLPGPVVGGGKQLLVLVAEPPEPWTIAVLEWRGR